MWRMPRMVSGDTGDIRGASARSSWQHWQRGRWNPDKTGGKCPHPKLATRPPTSKLGKTSLSTTNLSHLTARPARAPARTIPVWVWPAQSQFSVYDSSLARAIPVWPVRTRGKLSNLMENCKIWWRSLPDLMGNCHLMGNGKILWEMERFDEKRQNVMGKRPNLMENGQIWWETANPDGIFLNLLGNGKIWWEIAKSDGKRPDLMGNCQIWWEVAKSDGKRKDPMGNGKIWWENGQIRWKTAKSMSLGSLGSQ